MFASAISFASSLGIHLRPGVSTYGSGDCIFEACIDGTLDQCQLEWKKESSVCVVMAAEGYPGSYKKGQPISGLKDANALPEIVVFHAGTKEKNGETQSRR